MKAKVEKLRTGRGNLSHNQFRIVTDKGCFFQSYNKMIVFIPINGKTQLDENYWDYSRTTARYRRVFLNELTAETKRKIKEGIYTLTNLN